MLPYRNTIHELAYDLFLYRNLMYYILYDVIIIRNIIHGIDDSYLMIFAH